MHHAVRNDGGPRAKHVDEVEISCPAEAKVDEPAKHGRSETLVIAYRLRFVLLLIAIGTAQAVIPGPSAQFIKLTFFAARHGGGECATAPTSDPCRQASSDAAFYHGVAGAISHSFAWLFALVLGSYSDRLGRRPILVAKGLVSLISVLSLATHILGGVTLWFFLLLEPILTIFDVHSVFLAAMSDMVQDPKQRVTAYSLVMGASLAAGGPAGLIGGMVTAKVAVTAAITLGTIHLLFLVAIFPETAPLTRRAGHNPGASKEELGPLAATKDSLRLLRRDPFITRMTSVLVFSSLSATGFHNTFVPYLTAYMGFNKATNGRLMLVCGVSIAVSFIFLMKPLIARFGEFGVMRLCLALKVLFYFSCTAAWTRAQIFVAHGVLLGPVIIIFPIMSTIQSNLVGEEEQGRMQGVLAACKVLAHAVGDIFFGWFYKYATKGGTEPDRTAVLPPLLTSGVLAVVAAAIARSLNPGSLEHGDSLQKFV